MTDFTPEERKLLEQYVTSVDDSVFAVKNLPGIVGAAYARYSRAKGSFRQTLVKEFLKEGVIDPQHADKLIQRVLIAYGDDSVGELEGANMSFEDISNLAAKVIEDRRIGGSPIEQSSRYVVYNQKDNNGKWKYYRPQEIVEAGLLEEYESTLDRIFDIYDSLVEPMMSYYESIKPLEEAEYDILGTGTKQQFKDLESEKDQKAFKRTYKFDLKTKTCDTIRCLLPTATTTNVGMFGNGRFFQELISHLLTQEISEMHHIANKAHTALSQLIAPYVKRSKRNEWLADRRKEMRELCSEMFKKTPQKHSEITVNLLPQNIDGLDADESYFVMSLAQMVYPYCEMSLEDIINKLKRSSDEERYALVETYTGNRKHRRHRSDRGLEAGYPLVFDYVCDFGNYRDLQRHRMLSQQRQAITTRLGFQIPQDIKDAGFVHLIEEAQEICENLYEKVREKCGVETAQYVVLFGYNIRWTMGMNIRAAAHLVELRSTPQGHPHYRKVAQLMSEKITNRYPWTKEAFKFTDFNNYTWARADSEARQRVKEKQLEDKEASS